MANGTGGDGGTRVVGQRYRHRHSPLVRRLAAEYEVDPDGLAGTGPRGRVTRGDVLQAARRAPLVQVPVSGERTSPLLTLLGKRIVESLRVAALATRVVEVEVTGVACVGTALQRAAGEALRVHPDLQPLHVSVVDSDEVLFETGTVHPPQVAALTAGTPTARPVVHRDGRGADVVTVRDMVYLALTYDQRAVDPGEAAGFLAAVRSGLRPPA